MGKRRHVALSTLTARGPGEAVALKHIADQLHEVEQMFGVFMEAALGQRVEDAFGTLRFVRKELDRLGEETEGFTIGRPVGRRVASGDAAEAAALPCLSCFDEELCRGDCPKREAWLKRWRSAPGG